MQGQDVHQRAQAARQVRQAIRIRVGVVHSRDHHVLERHPFPEHGCRPEHRVQVVLLLDGHEPLPLGRGRGMERDGEAELLRPPGKGLHARQDAHGRDGDVPGADAESVGRVEGREGDVHRGPVEQRLAHAHEDDVARQIVRVPEDDLAHLARDLERREVPPESHPASGAEGASEGTARLARDAERPAAAGGDEHRFDRLSVGQPPQILPRAIGGNLLHLGREPRERECGVELQPERERQLGGIAPCGDGRLPQAPEHLAAAIGGQPALGGPAGQQPGGRGGRLIQEVGRGDRRRTRTHGAGT
jgi:hypothetical protein